MKRIMRFWAAGLIVATVQAGFAQAKVDGERMTRDIEVAENILSTLIRQQYDRKFFFPMDVRGNYMPGFGVTFRLPVEFAFPFMSTGEETAVIWSEDVPRLRLQGGVNAFSLDRTRPENGERTKVRELRLDSARTTYYDRLIEASKTFITDYADLISQLAPGERVLITNRGAGDGFWYGGHTKRTILSVEATKSDISDFRTGKISRDQLMKKIKVVNAAESEEEVAPDLELLSSIFSRLYREDLSDTYFAEEGIDYERLKDFGVIYYMKVYSSREEGQHRHRLPTLGLSDLDQEARDKKVTELYPQFEQEIKEHMVNYGRTLKSLQPDESLVFNIELTKCKGCGIPSTLELSVAYQVLNDFSVGKLTQEAAIARIEVRKGPLQ